MKRYSCQKWGCQNTYTVRLNAVAPSQSTPSERLPEQMISRSLAKPENFTLEEVFLAQMGMSKHVYGQANAAAPSQSTSSESLAKPEDFTLEEVFLSKMGMSKRVYGQANAAAPSAPSESLAKPEDVTLEEVSLSKIGMSRRKLKEKLP